jgi:hypothetical protein
MRLELGSPVHCSDGEFGELADVVIDPIKRRVTHLVVAPQHRPDQARLVPVDRARAQAPEQTAIQLGCTIAEVTRLESVQRSAYLRLGELPMEDPDWEIGVTDVLALPYYGTMTPGGVGLGMPPIGLDDHITEVYDRVPKDKIEVRRASAVTSADDHGLGHVDGFIVDDGERITHLVLEHGHLWGKREITIPVDAIASIETDHVTLRLSRDEVGELESVPVHRWSS